MCYNYPPLPRRYATIFLLPREGSIPFISLPLEVGIPFISLPLKGED